MFQYYSVFVLFCFSFGPAKTRRLQYSILGLQLRDKAAMLGGQYNRNLHENRVKFPDDRITFILVHQHGCREDMCKPAIKLTIYLITAAIYHPNYEMNYRTLTRQSPISR